MDTTDRPNMRKVPPKKPEPNLLGARTTPELLLASSPPKLMKALQEEPQKAIPAIAKSGQDHALVEDVIRGLPTGHQLYLGDSRDLKLAKESIELVVTSPPYWTLKDYNEHDDQLGYVEDYELFLDEIDRVWRNCYDALVPGGRLVVVVGDVNVSRRDFGRHMVFPLHASIQERCRAIGFDNLQPIFWHKIANAKYESGGSGFLGKPYEPNCVIKNDMEYILFQRKPGGYRKPTAAERLLSVISTQDHSEWFQQIWNITGASTRDHPAPYPVSLAERLIRMFSFVGDTVFDPFLGTGTTSVAAAKWGRNSIGGEVDPEYMAMATKRVSEAIAEHEKLFSKATA